MDFLLGRGPARWKMRAFRAKSMMSAYGTIEIGRVKKEEEEEDGHFLQVWLPSSLVV